MKVDKEKIGSCEYVLNIEVEPSRLQEPLQRAAQRLSKRRPLPGFRPGRAPYHMVERAFGKELIIDEMLDEMGSDLYHEALEHSDIEPYDRAEFEIAQVEPLALKVTVSAKPVVTMGDYRSIHVDEPPVTVSDAEVDEVLVRLQNEQALWVPVERSAKKGDQVVIDALGTTDDGHGVEQLDLPLELNDNITPRGFAENLVGVALGQTKEFDAEYPDDFRDKDVAGKTVHFKVTAKAIKQKELPELDDGLAQSLGGHESLDQLRGDIRQKLHLQKQVEADDAVLEQALDLMIEQATLEYPAIAVEKQIDTMQANLTDRLEQRGFTLEGYLHTMGKSLLQWREEVRPQAEVRLKRALVLAKLSEAEGIKVADEETVEEIDRLSSTFGERAEDVRAALSKEASLLSITNDVYRRKALDRLFSIATGRNRVREGGFKAVDADVGQQDS